MGIDEHLAEVRRGLARVQPEDLQTEVDAGAMVVDIRPTADREQFGELPGAVILERNVLEWRLCPTSDALLDGVTYDTRIILMCNDGYASSLAADSLKSLGLTRATDLEGGYNRWRQHDTPAPPA